VAGFFCADESSGAFDGSNGVLAMGGEGRLILSAFAGSPLEGGCVLSNPASESDEEREAVSSLCGKGASFFAKDNAGT
jgi:hypothetical protein